MKRKDKDIQIKKTETGLNLIHDFTGLIPMLVCSVSLSIKPACTNQHINSIFSLKFIYFSSCANSRSCESMFPSFNWIASVNGMWLHLYPVHLYVKLFGGTGGGGGCVSVMNL